MSEINIAPEFDQIAEMKLRDKVALRLQTDHSDMEDTQFQRWRGLLFDEDPRARTYAITAALAMMDVRDGPERANQARQQFDLTRKDK